MTDRRSTTFQNGQWFPGLASFTPRFCMNRSLATVIASNATMVTFIFNLFSPSSQCCLPMVDVWVRIYLFLDEYYVKKRVGIKQSLCMLEDDDYLLRIICSNISKCIYL